MIKKFSIYKLNEKVDDYIINIMKTIRSIDIKPEKTFIDLKKDFGISFIINIKKDKLEKFPLYNSNISIKEILKNNFENFNIEFFIKDDNINENKFYSILSHELSHVYQLLNDPDDKYFDSFNKMINIENFKLKSLEYKEDFLDYIYYNFLHELDARVNQAYESYLYLKKDTFENTWNFFINNSTLYKMLLFIQKFDSEDFIKRWDINELFILTNQFNTLYGIDNIDISKMKDYYKNWQKIFMNNSIEYIEKTKEAIYQAFHDEKRYNENQTSSFCYDESIIFKNKKYDIDEEILNLVNIFKKLPL